MGLVEDSEGAQIIHCGRQIPLMAVKSDGGFGYDSTDLAAVKYRIKEMQSSRVIYVTDAGQSEHFEMIFIAARKAGWCSEETCRLDHVPFGLVLGDDKKKFKTRSGEVTKLVDLLDEAVTRVKGVLQERMNTEGSTTQMTSDDVEHAARCIGYGCVKYADLRQHRIGESLAERAGDDDARAASWTRGRDVAVGGVGARCALDLVGCAIWVDRNGDPLAVSDQSAGDP